MIKSIYALKPYKDKLLSGLAGWLSDRQISANGVTLFGLILGLSAAGCLAVYQEFGAICLLSLSIGADMLDGTVARLTDGSSLQGKILDSVCDRIVEAAWVGVLVGSGRLPGWGLLLVVGSVLLLLCRIGAERVQLDSSFVRVTRFERMTAMLAVVLLPEMLLSKLIYEIITLGTFISSFQIMRAMGALRQIPGDAKQEAEKAVI